jgi:hypothetical protein
MRRRLDDGGESGRGETKALSSSLLSSNKFGARVITTPTGLQGGGSVILIIGAGTDLDVTSLLIKNFIPSIPMLL